MQDSPADRGVCTGKIGDDQSRQEQPRLQHLGLEADRDPGP